MKKKLLFVITKGSWGGAGRYVYDLAVTLKDEYDICVAAGGGGSLVDKIAAAGIRTAIIPSLERDIRLFGDVRAFKELLAFLRVERPDIVHLNSSKAGGIGALAARIARVRRIVYTAHGWAFNEPVSTVTKVFRWIASLATTLLCHRVITVSHFDMLHSPLGLHSVTVHNGISEIDFMSRADARREICSRAGIPEDSFIVGSISELHLNKGIDVLILAAYQVDHIQVVVMGEGEERGSLEELIRELKLEDRVHLIGFVEGAARYLKGFDVYTQPSRKEGLPYAILEAGMAEVPVIASAVGGIPEIVGDQISGDLVHAHNDENLAESLLELRDSPNTRAKYADALKARITRYFNLADMIRKTNDVYRS